MKRRRESVLKIAVIIGCLLLAGAGVFFGAQFVTKTGVFRVPGVVYYDDNLTEEERAAIAGVLEDDVVLDKDVIVKVRHELILPALAENERLVGVYVPVTGFYNDETDVVVSRADELWPNCDCGWRMIDVSELDHTQKLLSINGRYYLDDYAGGAVFRIISFESEKYAEEISPLVGGLFQSEYPRAETVTTLAQTGVTAFSRLMNAKMDVVDSGEYFAAGLSDFLSKYDFVHTSSEASFYEAASRSGATGTPICSDPRFIDTLKAIKLNIVELTGNHNADCGYKAAAETVDIYRENGIRIVGGGKNADEAAVPLVLDDGGSEVTLLAYNLSTGGATLGNYPGANQYYEEVAAAQIREAKARGNLVIVDMQYYECSAYVSDIEDATCDSPAATPGDEVGFFRHLVDLGADVVVGTSAHQPQTYELYGGGAIYYGLGNLFFDQYRWPGTTRSLILVHHIYNGKILQTEVRPTQYDGDFVPELLDAESSEAFLNRLKGSRP
ncbi:CapA family protein [Candidatus Saccharibacteria bacterium]|nr:CapA family protein [Candidatus Saccharibacteria bacterium]